MESGGGDAAVAVAEDAAVRLLDCQLVDPDVHAEAMHCFGALLLAHAQKTSAQSTQQNSRLGVCDEVP